MVEYTGKFVILMLCSECNNNCSHCYIDYKGRFSDDELSKLVPELLKKYKVDMNGTEPILFEEYFKYFKMAGNTRILTNGIALIDNYDLMNKLKANGIDTIRLSYHYGIQDKISSIKMVELDRLIEQLLDNDFKVKLMCSLSKDNYKCIDEFCDKALSLGVESVKFTNFINQGNAKINYKESSFLDRDQIKYVLEEIDEERKKYNPNKLYIERCGSFGQNNNGHKSKFKCLYMNNIAVITPDKKVYGCVFDIAKGNEIGFLDDDNRIIFFDEPDKNDTYCKVLKKNNHVII